MHYLERVLNLLLLYLPEEIFSVRPPFKFVYAFKMDSISVPKELQKMLSTFLETILRSGFKMHMNLKQEKKKIFIRHLF